MEDIEQDSASLRYISPFCINEQIRLAIDSPPMVMLDTHIDEQRQWRCS